MKYLPIQINQEWFLRVENKFSYNSDVEYHRENGLYNAYDATEKEAIAKAKPIINHDGREWYDESELDEVWQWYDEAVSEWIDTKPTELSNGFSAYKKIMEEVDVYTRQAWKYIGEKPLEKLTEQQILQQPKELFMEQQLHNNMPEGYKAAKLIDLFSYMFRMGFENGINWQKEQENTAERTRIIGIIDAEIERLSEYKSNRGRILALENLLTKIKDL